MNGKGLNNMILDKKIEVVCSGKLKKYYENLGYSLPYAKDKRGRIGIKKGSKIVIDIYDLPTFSQVKIKYKCDDCGSEKESNAQTIFSRKNSQYNKSGETICSRCANSRMSGKNSGAYKHGSIRYPEYRNNARRRGIEFLLTVNEFNYLVSMQCHYCGGNSVDNNEKSRGNGIDRKNSKVGYILQNCVPCCSTCNFVKNQMPYEKFIKYIKNLYERTKNYEV